MPIAETPESKKKKEEFSKRFMEARIDAKISQTLLAKKTGISNSTISNYECGKTMPDKTNMKKLVKALPVLSAGKETNGGTVMKLKSSLITHAKESGSNARTEFMKSLVVASKDLRTLLAASDKAKIPQTEAFDMLKLLLAEE